MSEVYVGNCISGSFKPQDEINSIENAKVEKDGGVLYLLVGNKRVELSPLNEDSKMIVLNFSEEIGDLNESVYSLELNNALLTVLLYTYTDVQKLLTESQIMAIHLRRETEKQICSMDGYKNKFFLNSEKEIVPFLYRTFMNNNSIFVHLDPKNKNGFQMFGANGLRARVRMERPGVYVIDDFLKTQNKEYSFSLTQLFGKGTIKFVSWNDAISVEGNSVTELKSIRTSEVFKAWEEYMNFEKTVYENDLKDTDVIRYNNISVDEESIIIHTPNPIPYEAVQNKEFEFISKASLAEDEIPKTVEDILCLKEKRIETVFVGECQNDYSADGCLHFRIPYKGFRAEMIHSGGVLYLSDRSIRVEQNRRRKVLRVIESKSNESSNIIMRLSDPNVVDSQLGTSIEPISSVVLKKMFGNPNFQVKENYRDAMSIALNTPDIALIQGPPGTGKTTLIKGLITRINAMNKNYKILVSSEQHEALFNVVDKLSQNKLIPPFVSSRKYNDDEEDIVRFEKTTRDFQTNFINVCNDLLRDEKNKGAFSSSLSEFVFILQNIREMDYAGNFIISVLDKMKSLAIDMGGDFSTSVENEFSNLSVSLKLSLNANSSDELDAVTRFIIRKINAQRTDIDVYLDDDGERQLLDLQKHLEHEYPDYLMPPSLKNDLLSGNKAVVSNAFDRYISYVIELKETFIPRVPNEFDDVKQESVKDIIEKISEKTFEFAQHKNRNFSEVVESLLFRLNDIDSVAEIIKNYTSIIGSTCAQAEKSIELVELTNDRYDYVIIDEAGRANPLDIMLPIMLGIKVILIGDQNQLPHYIETDYVNRLEKESQKYSEFDRELLTKSFFQILFENLEKAFTEGRLKCKRTAQIGEQHRMHPTIGNFVSAEFYNGRIENGANTSSNRNDYNVYNGKNLVWLNISIFKGPEKRINQSLQREPEVEKIIEVIKILVQKNEGRKLNIGIVSYYKGQVDLICERLQENFPKEFISECISCDTVDSYQGKEFDITIISGVRSNRESTAEKALGFIHYSASRINVSLSRARRLLIVVGDADTYRKNPHFEHFINYAKEQGLYE